MWAFDLIKTTMKPLYDEAYGDDPDMEAEFGWKEKKEELWSDHAWYLLARWENLGQLIFEINSELNSSQD